MSLGDGIDLPLGNMPGLGSARPIGERFYDITDDAARLLDSELFADLDQLRSREVVRETAQGHLMLSGIVSAGGVGQVIGRG